jgi:hypothetical protein
MSKDGFIEDAYNQTNFGGPDKIYAYLKKNYYEESSEKNIMKVAAEKAKVEKVIKQIDPQQENVQRETRSRKQTEFFAKSKYSTLPTKQKRR